MSEIEAVEEVELDAARIEDIRDAVAASDRDLYSTAAELME